MLLRGPRCISRGCQKLTCRGASPHVPISICLSIRLLLWQYDKLESRQSKMCAVVFFFSEIYTKSLLIFDHRYCGVLLCVFCIAVLKPFLLQPKQNIISVVSATSIAGLLAMEHLLNHQPGLYSKTLFLVVSKPMLMD